MTEHDSTFDRRAVVRLIAEHAPHGAPVGLVEAHADAFLASRHVEAVGVALTGVQYSTVELLAIEQRLLRNAVLRRNEGVAVCDPSAEVCERSLSAEQRAMVVSLTTNGAGVSVVVGAAGTGKTHALGVARESWERAGHMVIGCALAARAADELQTTSRIPSSTLDSLLVALDRPDSRGLGRRTVVVVDEAAMIGTRKLARLLDHAQHARAKVVLVGDHHQLPAIEAGGAFAALAHRLGAIQLRANQRQIDPIERQALAELRGGEPDRAIDLLDAYGRIDHHASRATAHAQMVDGWLEATLAGEDAIMLAPLRADVAELNRLARAALIDRAASPQTRSPGRDAPSRSATAS